MPNSTIDLDALTTRHPRWSVTDKGLVADFAFSSYMAGIDFAIHVAKIAEAMNHHPEIVIGWRKVRLTIMTHSKKAITALDEEFVGKVDECFGNG